MFDKYASEIILATVNETLEKDGVNLGKLLDSEGWKGSAPLHITTSYSKPEFPPLYSDIGTPAVATIVGVSYNPEVGIALDVEVPTSLSERIVSECQATVNERPMHITIANPEGVEPVRSAELLGENGVGKYIAIEPFQVLGTYGGMTIDRKVDVMSRADKLLDEYLSSLTPEQYMEYLQQLMISAEQSNEIEIK